ncbi:BTB/POZ domain-containing protein [Ditylenchus destructor]|uniref:BTB/POZ domain-containing protein n=1 Tax=Ditylenchus destructor TaxID=166010 RepID=A0AAD4NCI0_9BILA|nr:BTB/POZ domain-containing protein [Ditylenchus destructor]
MCNPIICVKSHDQKISVEEFFHEQATSDNVADDGQMDSDAMTKGPQSLYGSLNKMQRLALMEAHYYAAEVSRLKMALRLRSLGVPWSGYTLFKCFQIACTESMDAAAVLLNEFSDRFMDDLSRPSELEDFVYLMFDLITHQSANPSLFHQVAKIINQQFSDSFLKSCEKTLADSSRKDIHPAHSRSLIDSKFVDNPDFSDIKFLVEGKTVYAHRIVLVNTSERFCELLKDPNGVVELNDVTYSVFRAILEYIYSSNADFRKICTDCDISHLLNLLLSSRIYGLHSLNTECLKFIKSMLSNANCLIIHSFAQENSFDTLVSGCEDFMLCHLAELTENADFIACLRSHNFKRSLIARFIHSINHRNPK